ncbi:UNVERIFIED_CONTAM: Casein kinase II subunit alpha-1 [Sesamum latifolium]|uniref:Casein kinase II subunit alpha-1 n=1 Tax=Sesamum latifolium TaxID=2727402 RepID=A0AAW2X7T9_9LAMI
MTRMMMMKNHFYLQHFLIHRVVQKTLTLKSYIIHRHNIVCALVALWPPVTHLPAPGSSPSSYFHTITKIGDAVSPEIYSSGMSKARVYTDVNVLRPREYWDYENLTVQWGK